MRSYIIIVCLCVRELEMFLFRLYIRYTTEIFCTNDSIATTASTAVYTTAERVN